MDKKVSRYSYHHSVVLRAEIERVSVLELERDINLTDSETGGGAGEVESWWAGVAPQDIPQDRGLLPLE